MRSRTSRPARTTRKADLEPRSPLADSMAPSVLSTTLSLVGLQVASRLFSFGLNQALLRSTTPQAFGLATIQLDTLAGTVLFLLREGIRGAVVVRTDAGPF